jgi:hypothetical protein
MNFDKSNLFLSELAQENTEMNSLSQELSCEMYDYFKILLLL